MTSVYGFNHIIKYNVNGKKIYLLGELHEKEFSSYFIEKVKKETKKNIIGTSSFIEMLLKDNSNNKIHFLAEGPGEHHPISYFESVKQYDKLDKYFDESADVIFRKYVFGLYKNYINMIQEEHSVKNSLFKIKEKDMEDNAIALSNFHKNIDFHLVDYRGPNLFKNYLTNDWSYESVLYGTVPENPLDLFQNLDYMIKNKLIELDGDKYITVFGKMFNMLSTEAQSMINNFMKNGNGKHVAYSFGQPIMDTVALIKLLYYLSNSYRQNPDPNEENSTIIIYGGSLHTKFYANFFNDELNVQPEVVLTDGPSINFIDNVELSDLFDGNYEEYIKDINTLYHSNTINMLYKYDELDEHFLSYFYENKEINHRSFIKEINEIKSLLKNVIDLVNLNIEDPSNRIDIDIPGFNCTHFTYMELEDKNIESIILMILQTYNGFIYYTTIDSETQFIYKSSLLSLLSNVDLETLQNYNKVILKNKKKFLIMDEGDNPEEFVQKRIGKYEIEKMIDILIGKKIGGSDNFKKLEAIEFDEITGTTKQIKRMMKANKFKFQIMQPVKQLVEVYGGSASYTLIFITILLLLVLLFDSIFCTELCQTDFISNLSNKIF